MITPKELKEFEHYAQVQYMLDTSHEVPVVTIESSKHNETDSYDLMCLQELQIRANETIEVTK